MAPFCAHHTVALTARRPRQRYVPLVGMAQLRIAWMLIEGS
jgi:hypothetical protein